MFLSTLAFQRRTKGQKRLTKMPVYPEVEPDSEDASHLKHVRIIGEDPCMGVCYKCRRIFACLSDGVHESVEKHRKCKRTPTKSGNPISFDDFEFDESFFTAERIRIEVLFALRLPRGLASRSYPISPCPDIPVPTLRHAHRGAHPARRGRSPLKQPSSGCRVCANNRLLRVGKKDQYHENAGNATHRGENKGGKKEEACETGAQKSATSKGHSEKSRPSSANHADATHEHDATDPHATGTRTSNCTARERHACDTIADASHKGCKNSGRETRQEGHPTSERYSSSDTPTSSETTTSAGTHDHCGDLDTGAPSDAPAATDASGPRSTEAIPGPQEKPQICSCS